MFVLFCFGLLVARLVWLQVVRHEHYLAQAEDNRIALVPIVPNRGLILDRNGVVLATQLLGLHAGDHAVQAGSQPRFRDRRAGQAGRRSSRRTGSASSSLLEESKNFASVPIRTRLSDEEVARFTAQRFRFPGVEVQARLFRQYPLGEVASHVLGYIGRINQNEAKAHRGKRRRGQLQRHRPHRQGRPGEELRAPAARP